jgi:hypothetical protein
VSHISPIEAFYMANGPICLGIECGRLIRLGLDLSSKAMFAAERPDRGYPLWDRVVAKPHSLRKDEHHEKRVGRLRGSASERDAEHRQSTQQPSGRSSTSRARLAIWHTWSHVLSWRNYQGKHLGISI